MERIMKLSSVTMFAHCVHMFYMNDDATAAMSVYIYNTHYDVIFVNMGNDDTWIKTYNKDMTTWCELDDNKIKELHDDTIATGKLMVISGD